MTTTISGIDGVSKVQNGVVQAGFGPAFRAYASGVTSIGTTPAKVTLAAESFDTAGVFDTTLSRFSPTVAGYYQINARISFSTLTSIVQAHLRKNNVAITLSGLGVATAEVNTDCLVYLNGAGDYIELFAYSNNTQNTVASETQTYLTGFLARAA